MTGSTTVSEAAEHEVDPTVHNHPTDRDYVKIALILGVITALEVGTYFWEDLFGSHPSTTALVLSLFPMMIAKFLIVIGYFMHLKYDNPLFKRVFVFGLLLAIAVYTAVFFAFEFFDDRFFRFLEAG
ncbi:MAG: cytochrome C oxidase subunit IV family protein [Actinomycetota bacterium]